jgi:hypothetical protein
MVLLVIDHLLGDGYFMTRLLGAIVETATTGTVPEPLRRPAARRPVPRAVWDFFGRHPGRARALARHVRAATATPIEPGSRGATDWRPSPASRIRRSDPQALKGLKEWRREHASGISTVPLTIAAAEVARRRLGIPLTAPPLILFDARRYVRPGGVDVAGNFCAGLRITVADSGDPLAVDAAIKEAVELGRPLAVVAATAATLRLRGRLSRPTAAASAAIPVGEAWDVAYTHMGRPPELSRLQWEDGAGRPYFVGLLPPNGPAGVTVGMSEMGHRMNVSVSFHDNVVRAELVDALLDLLVGDPAALLEQHRSGVYQPMVA